MNLERAIRILAKITKLNVKRVRDTWSIECRKDLVRLGDNRYHSELNSRALKEYWKQNIDTGAKPTLFGGKDTNYVVLFNDFWFKDGSLQVTHYWCANRMNVTRNGIHFNTGGSGVCNAKEELEKDKPVLLEEYDRTIDIFEAVVDAMLKEEGK